MEGAEVTIVHRGGAIKKATLLGFDDVKRPIVLLRFPLAGTYRANLNHGWLEKPCDDWRIGDNQLEEMRSWANRKEHWVTVVPRSSGRPVAPKKARKVSPKQAGFQGGAWLK